MERYLISYNPDTGAMTASMKHSVLKIIETFLTSDLPVQNTPYSMDLFDPSVDSTFNDQPSYQRLVGMAIWLLKLRFETQLAVIMACSHNTGPTLEDPDHKDLHQSNPFGVQRVLHRDGAHQVLLYLLHLSWISAEGPYPFSILTAPHFPKNSKNLLVQDRTITIRSSLSSTSSQKASLPYSMLSSPDH
jgi:hypothetical protein